jgi:hypothetical protein
VVTGGSEREKQREHCCDVRWRNSCSLIWCVDQSFAVRKDGELNMWGVPTDHHQVVAYKAFK